MTSEASEEAKATIYRAFLDGEATVSEVRAVFGDDMDAFFDRLRFLSVVQSTPTNTPEDSLFE